MNKYISVLALIIFSVPTLAADGPLKGEMHAYNVVKTDGGEETLEAAERAAPGNVIEYQLSYENTGERPLAGLVVTGPVPSGVEYVENTAEAEVDAELQVSVDDGASWEQIPVVRTVIEKDGTVSEEVVPASEYTHLRWTANTPLAPSTSNKYSYRVQVESGN